MPVKVINFGCRLNSYEGEVIKNQATQAGLENVIILNSCAVTSEAERQLRQTIRKVSKQYPNAKLIVTGCAAQINPDKYASMPEISSVIGNQEKVELAAYQSLANNFNTALPYNTNAESVIVTDIQEAKELAQHLIAGFENRARAFMQVQNGCNHRCTFCIIPYGRGNSRSIPIGEIVKQARILTDQGYKEIVITGVDITDYGLDLPGQPKLGQMLKRVIQMVPQIERIRLSSLDVAEIDEDLFCLIQSEPRLMPHLHLSLQSGDDLILKRMKRRHSARQVREFCEKVTKLRPGLALGADIIVGFPTETEEMYQNTKSLVQELQICHLHIFPYSERDGTPAARMPQVSKDIRKSRAKDLRELGSNILHARHQNMIGKKVQVLLEEGGNHGRTEDYCLATLKTASPIHIDLSHSDIEVQAKLHINKEQIQKKQGDIVTCMVYGATSNSLLVEEI